MSRTSPSATARSRGAMSLASPTTSRDYQRFHSEDALSGAATSTTREAKSSGAGTAAAVVDHAPFARGLICCSAFLLLLGPCLIIAGSVLSATSNPQDAQRASIAADTTTFVASATVLSRTEAIASTVLLEGGLTTIPTSLQGGVSLAVAHRDVPLARTSNTGAADSGPTVQSVFLSTPTGRTLKLTENVGPGVGSITLLLTYDHNAQVMSTPPITLTKDATRPVYCTQRYASICGTLTCCTPNDMQIQCTTIAARYSSTATSYVASSLSCNLGDECGYCSYQQYVTEACFILQYSNLLGWSVDRSRASCKYPFSSLDQTYGDSDAGAAISLRSADDPYVSVQAITKGTGLFDDDRSSERAMGRGLLIFGILAWLVLAVIVGLTYYAGYPLHSPAFIKVAMKGGVLPSSSRGGGSGGSRSGVAGLDEDDDQAEERRRAAVVNARLQPLIRQDTWHGEDALSPRPPRFDQRPDSMMDAAASRQWRAPQTPSQAPAVGGRRGGGDAASRLVFVEGEDATEMTAVRVHHHSTQSPGRAINPASSIGRDDEDSAWSYGGGGGGSGGGGGRSPYQQAYDGGGASSFSYASPPQIPAYRDPGRRATMAESRQWRDPDL